MGVTGLWSVVAPTARPTKLETLNRKRLAVDASIWIYQFLKAVRDKEGNALRNSHVVGFFRRICKLLYFGILPVFVFDGGAPGLKRETIQKRQRRREGRREDATRTAGKLLAVQVAKAAEDEDRRRRETRPKDEETIQDDEELVYVDELGMSKQERTKERAERFKKKDQYHLPDLDVSLTSMGAPNDPRIMSQAELEEYARQFHSGEDINLYDFSKIDFESPFFLSLPAGDRYNILNAARLRSRLRMGYSKEQLDGMFPDRMAFSRFQIERVKERNELTQRLMHLNGMNEDWDQGGRIAGEKGKEYILVKNEGVEGGWALGVVSNKQGTQREDAIDVDADAQSLDLEEDEDDDEDFEDVAIEGLNRIPKSMKRSKKDLRDIDYDVSYEHAAEEIAKKRKAVYDARKRIADSKPVERTEALRGKPEAGSGNLQEDNDLFVAQDEDIEEGDELFEDVPIDVIQDDDEDLQRALAMSLDTDEQPAGGFMPEEQAAVSEGDSSDDELDLGAALAESRRLKNKPIINVRPSPPPPKALENRFGGPLPFESLNLGQSLLGKKKADAIEQNHAGGFDRDAGNDAFRKPKKAQPLPSWFNATPGAHFRHVSEDDNSDDHITYGREDNYRREFLRRKPIEEVIDLEAENSDVRIDQLPNEVYYGDGDQTMEEDSQVAPFSPRELSVEIREPDIDDSVEEAEKETATRQREERYKLAREIAAENDVAENDTTSTEIATKSQRTPPLMSDIAEHAQANPPAAKDVPNSIPNYQPQEPLQNSEEGEEIDWSESEHGELADAADNVLSGKTASKDTPSEEGTQVSQGEDDEGEEFEDVEVGMDSRAAGPVPPVQSNEEIDEQFLIVDDPHNKDDHHDEAQTTDGNSFQNDGIDGYLSESEEELMRQLVLEAEGHAEFASSLNQIKTPAEAARDYENELKQLRNQQKKDRRDADEVTQVMIQECQALLRLFGLPYITAPMEAEAQCAELVHLGLVDGIVTDDSDIFLFGGTRIYKNMFNAAKFVECYVSQDLEKEYDLDRRKMIRFAHLLGSDYTEGIPGIGPVTALEIITDFGDLEQFRDWCSKVQMGRPQDLESQLTTPFRRKFKKTVQKKLFLPPVFPDLRVDNAYLKPDVDSNPEDFQWGVPDLDKLRGFLMATIGWSQDRTDEILVPVIRDMNKRIQEGTQANITRFFTGSVGVGAASVEGAAPRNRTGKESGRMKNAYARLRGEAKKKRFQADDGDLADEEDAAADAVNETEELTGSTKRKSSLRDVENDIVPEKSSKGKKRKTKS